jgi:DNA repair protein RadD
MKQTLRDYQTDGLNRILGAFREGARSVLAVSPTGSGKTTIFGSWVSDLGEAGRKALILVHRRELATQAANRLIEFGTDFGFIMSGEQAKPYANVQIGSVQTLVRRLDVLQNLNPGLVICDEAHLSTAKTWTSILETFPKAKIAGFTATPWRLGGKPLVGAYDACVVVTTPSELREQGHLSPYVGFSYKTPDLSGVKTTGGDYNEKQTAELMTGSVIVDSVVEEWLKHASGLSTVVFAVTVEHSKQLTEKFRAAGVAAEHLDGQTTLDARRAILKRVETGITRVLCNVGVAVEGLDIPRLKCCVLARPTKSLARAIQMMGRVRRPWNGVTARIHDHAFVIGQHGLPDSERDYTLTAKPEKPPSLKHCSSCLAVYEGSSCPACGAENEPVTRGDRELNTVTDAEQYAFDSETESTEVSRPPVDVKWNAVGRVVEGKLLRRWNEETQYGQIQRFLVQGEKRQHSFPGTTRLNALMARVEDGSVIRVTYTGETALAAARTRKEFKVEIDDGRRGL